MVEIPDLLTPAEVATKLRVSVRQVYNLVADPDCPLTGTRISHKTMRIYAESVEATIQKGAPYYAAS